MKPNSSNPNEPGEKSEKSQKDVGKVLRKSDEKIRDIFERHNPRHRAVARVSQAEDDDSLS